MPMLSFLLATSSNPFSDAIRFTVFLVSPPTGKIVLARELCGTCERKYVWSLTWCVGRWIELHSHIVFKFRFS